MRAHSIPEPDVTTIITIKREPHIARPTGLRGRTKLFPAAIATLFIALVLVLQWVGGAYRSEFAGYPDEGAHYITGVMMRDYVAVHKLVSFRQYAEDYYLHYPKVALGHWPPVFYTVE